MKTAATLAALLLIAGCSTAEPAEPETVTATATETEGIKYLPPACRDALMYADEVIDHPGTVTEIAKDVRHYREMRDQCRAQTP